MNVCIKFSDGSRMEFSCKRPNFSVGNAENGTIASVYVTTTEVKELTLTDEQINALDNEVKYSELSLYHHEYMRRFARLVLKKATNGEI